MIYGIGITILRDYQRNITISVFILVDLLHVVQDGSYACFLNLSRQDDLVQNDVDLWEVEDQVQLADRSEVLLHRFNVQVDRLHHGQLVVVHVAADREEQPSIPSVNYLHVSVLNEVCLLCGTGRDYTDDFLLQNRSLLSSVLGVVFRDSCTT